MQTVVLAAGAGTHLRPLTEQMPKPMLPVGDRPLVAIVADAAVAAGASELVVVVGYRGAHPRVLQRHLRGRSRLNRRADGADGDRRRRLRRPRAPLRAVRGPQRRQPLRPRTAVRGRARGGGPPGG